MNLFVYPSFILSFVIGFVLSLKVIHICLWKKIILLPRIFLSVINNRCPKWIRACLFLLQTMLLYRVALRATTSPLDLMKRIMTVHILNVTYPNRRERISLTRRVLSLLDLYAYIRVYRHTSSHDILDSIRWSTPKMMISKICSIVLHFCFNFHHDESSSFFHWLSFIRRVQFAVRMTVAFLVSGFLAYGTALNDQLATQYLIPVMSVMTVQETFGMTLAASYQMLTVITPLSICLYIVQRIGLGYEDYVAAEFILLISSFFLAYKCSQVICFRSINEILRWTIAEITI